MLVSFKKDESGKKNESERNFFLEMVPLNGDSNAFWNASKWDLNNPGFS